MSKQPGRRSKGKRPEGAPHSKTPDRDSGECGPHAAAAKGRAGADDVWTSLSGKRVDDIVAEVRLLVGDEERIVHVGTDAQHRGFRTDYVTVIAVLTPGKGGRVFYKRERTPRTKSLAQKLFREAELSIGVATRIAEHVAQEIVVHIDANEDLRHRSSDYVQALAGMVVGYGFQVAVKPNSWCATHVADRVVKERHAPSASRSKGAA